MAAIGCARAGLRVALLERGRPGREKCCAGGVLNRSIDALQDIHLPSSIIEREIAGLAFIVQGSYYPITLRRPLGVMVRRSTFDGYLVDRSEKEGVEVHHGAHVKRAHEDAHGVSVELGTGSIEGRYLVVADGAGGRLADTIVGKHPANWCAVGSALEVVAKAPMPGIMEVHLLSYGQRALSPGPSFPLTGAVFPRKDSMVISIVGKSYPARAFAAGTKAIMDDLDARGLRSEAQGRPCFYPLPVIPRPRLSSSRAVVVGDAAGLVNPFSGEGISSALLSGDIASKVLKEACTNNKTSSLRRYDAEVRRLIIPRLNAASLLGPMLHRFVAVLGHERLIANFLAQGELIDECVDFSSGEIGLGSFLWGAMKTMPSLLRSPRHPSSENA